MLRTIRCTVWVSSEQKRRSFLSLWVELLVSPRKVLRMRAAGLTAIGFGSPCRVLCVTCCSLLQMIVHSLARVLVLLCVTVFSSAAITGCLFTDFLCMLRCVIAL